MVINIFSESENNLVFSDIIKIIFKNKCLLYFF